MPTVHPEVNNDLPLLFSYRETVIYDGLIDCNLATRQQVIPNNSAFWGVVINISLPNRQITFY